MLSLKLLAISLYILVSPQADQVISNEHMHVAETPAIVDMINALKSDLNAEVICTTDRFDDCSIEIYKLSEVAPELYESPKREEFATAKDYDFALAKFNQTGNWRW